MLGNKDNGYLIMKNIIFDVRSIILESRNKAIHSVNFSRVMMYHKIGKLIVTELQGNRNRADYGSNLLKRISDNIVPEFGSGFSVRILELSRQFYRIFPNTNTLYSQLNWSQYRLLIRIDNQDRREFYIAESVKNNWSKRELERQINSQLFERLLLSNDKESVLEVARKSRIPEHPKEIIKDPMVLEFLGLDKKAHYYEKDLESAIISHLQDFLLELGNGFSFVNRQKRINIEEDEFFIDLVFYNRLLRCFVLFEIKTHKLTHQDLGQLQMYVNYYDRIEKLPDENPTIGILLCADKNNTMVNFALPENNSTILASSYKLYLPSEEQLIKEMKKEINEIYKKTSEL
jgi:predicted nuclease of restriction endonuclease-like (RecB) superfamily